jgi:hypothetical protein
MVENYAPYSRPQSGLGAASTIFETLAEGGITRFLAVYLENDSARVGPVRSTRIYFDSLAGGLHAILATVGGNDDALTLLRQMPSIFTINENRWEISLYDTGTPLFWRSADRAPPHNLYTSTYKLRTYAAQHSQNWAYTQAYWSHKGSAPLAQRGRAGSITLTLENPLNPVDNPDYDVRYVYDRASNTYRRYLGGPPNVDAGTGRILAPANVVVMKTGDASADPNAGPLTVQAIRIPVTGSGVAWFFRDGKVLRGTWRQRNKFAPLRFYDRAGRQVALNPGQTWIEVLPASSHATWSFR